MLLLTTAIVDMRTYRLLDVFTIPIAAVSALLAFRQNELGLGLLASALSVLILSLLKLILERRRQKSMLGWGDVKLVAALALGLHNGTPVMMCVAACLGLAVVPIRSKQKAGAIPFGPMLSAATMLTYLVFKDHF
ncbi:MAG: prepilin peptidase [Asticcacaulis sp.]|uniref:prepilin peptidase n=1 Tax=Asticcacaulis sp. TaxID=1872648 RepID=UPI003F7C0269